jgi:DNA-binding response OmpR family regulator
LFFKINNLLLNFMSNKKIVLYDCNDIYKILDEIKQFLDLDIKYLNKKTELENLKQVKNDYIIISKKKIETTISLLVLENLPIKIKDLMEKISIKIIKKNYNLKSNLKIGKYLLNINSREIFDQNKKIKLTEQEVKILVYLSDMGSFVKINELQEKIWGYNIDLETHTVETHIHRLKKKFIEGFGDRKLIKSDRNGYKIDSL